MLLGNQAKKIAATIVSGGPSKKEPFVQEMGDSGSGEDRVSFEKVLGSEDAEHVSDTDAGLEAATDKMMSALKNDDTSSFRSALKSFIVLANLSELDEPEVE